LGLSTAAARRIGLYGGAFDPPHLAHHALAQAAIAQYELDVLIILPTGQAWHKSRHLTAHKHRLAMAKLGFCDVPQARIDPRETLRSGVSYTFDTLTELKAENPRAQLYLLMGEDQWRFFPQWHRYEEIAQNATLLVALRADSMPAKGQNSSQKQGKIQFLPIQMPASPISATQIRQNCDQQLPIDHLVKPAVARYIAENRLYQSTI
jgi:nicotinate-nucleotide adenylyltransferase